MLGASAQQSEKGPPVNSCIFFSFLYAWTAAEIEKKNSSRTYRKRLKTMVLELNECPE